MTQSVTAESRPKQSKSRGPRRMARAPGPADPDAAGSPADKAVSRRAAPSKLDTIEALLLAEGGATIAEVMAATGWLQHSVRGAMAGALRKRGLVVTSAKIDGLRRYRAHKPQ